MNPLIQRLPLGINEIILNKLNDQDLVNYCSTSQETRDYCDNNQTFWVNRAHRRFGLSYEDLHKYNPFPVDDPYRWSNYYIDVVRLTSNTMSADKLFWNAITNQKRKDIALIALNRGAKIQGPYLGTIPIEYGDMEMLEFLAKIGYKFDPEHYVNAAQANQVNSLRFLVEQNVPYTALYLGMPGTTVLSQALDEARSLGHQEVVEYLETL